MLKGCMKPLSATLQESKKPREIPIYNCGYVCNVFLTTFTAKLKNFRFYLPDQASFNISEAEMEANKWKSVHFSSFQMHLEASLHLSDM
jgi:hypothetical protein